MATYGNTASFRPDPKTESGNVDMESSTENRRTAWWAVGQAAVLAALVIGLAGCGGGGSSSVPPPPMSGSITFSSPASQTTVTTLPLSITVTLGGSASLQNTKITLNGAEVTSQFVTSGNVATASIRQGVYVGNNRLNATVSETPTTAAASGSATFTYDPSRTSGAPPEGTPPTSSTTLADVIPIQTRVRMKNAAGDQVWGVQIGQQAFPAPDTTNAGFQLLGLKRSDLSVVNNFDIDMTQSNAGNVFDDELRSMVSNGACLTPGCLIIVQSLNQIGPPACPGQGESCSNFLGDIQNLGGTALLGSTLINDSNGIGYSLIASVASAPPKNVPIWLHAGSSAERLSCDTSDGCIQQSKPDPNSATVLNGIAPNGLDGVVPNLANTGSQGTTNIASTAFMPGMTVSNNGAMHGVLVQDNHGNYAFTVSDPPIHFQMGAAANTSTPKHTVILNYPAGSAFTFPNGTAQLAADSAALPAGAKGGFHLVAWDATTWQNAANSTYVIDPTKCGTVAKPSCVSSDGTTLYPLRQMITDIQNLNSRRYLIFVGSIGSLDHNLPDPFDPGSNAANMQDVWDRVSQSIQDIGGTYSLFTSLNYPGYANNMYDQFTPQAVPEDDYNLIGQWWLNDSNVPNPLALETSLHMNRETMAAPISGNAEGTLEEGSDGYYRAGVSSTSAGIFSDAALTLASAPTMLPTPWPLTGANDSNALKAAYMWISQQLFNCVSGCGDIRAAYTNLNQSPEVWLTLINSLEIPSDCAGETSAQCPLGFGQSEFDTAKAQLGTEIQYLGLVRQYQNNLLGSLQNEQANVALLLQQSSSEVLGHINYVVSTTVPAGGWRSKVEDSFKIAGPLLGIALGVVPGGGSVTSLANFGFGLADYFMDQGAKRTFDPNGRSLQEQALDQVAVGQLAQSEADQYAATLTTMGKDYSRIVSDWGRLQAVAIPIQMNQLVWTPEDAGSLLTVYNNAIRRGFYSQLLPVSYNLTHYRYTDPGTPGNFGGVLFRPGSPQCGFFTGLPNLQSFNPDSYAFIPGAPIDGPGSTVAFSVGFGNLYPTDVWWDLWMMQDENANPNCPTDDTSQLPTQDFYNETQLFRPLDVTNPDNLGLYKPWFYLRNGFNVDKQVDTTTNFWQTNGISGGQPYIRGMANWHPDPDNY
jgi:hypothetical protein